MGLPRVSEPVGTLMALAGRGCRAAQQFPCPATHSALTVLSSLTTSTYTRVAPRSCLAPASWFFCSRNISFLKYFWLHFALKIKRAKSICVAIFKSDSITPHRAAWLLTQPLTAVILPFSISSAIAIDTR